MRAVRDYGVVLVLLIVFLLPTVSANGELDFEARVAAQAAIEHVYHAHRTDAPASFEEAVPRAVLERKVRTYLAQSAVLEQRWNLPITAEALRQELNRIAARTRMPGRLRELFAALDDDPVLIQECLVRPILVDRLTRGFFDADERIHSDARTSIANIHEALRQGELDPMVAHPVRELTRLLRIENPDDPRDTTGYNGIRTLFLETREFDTLRGRAPARTGEIGDVVAGCSGYEVRVVLDEQPGNVLIATYSSPRISWEEWWADRSSEHEALDVTVIADAGVPLPILSGRGAAPCDGDFWDNGALDDLPDQRYGQTAVWTGSEMILWGGSSYRGSPEWTGLRYDPATDSWNSTARSAVLQGRYNHEAVWSGTEMIVWGGTSGFLYYNTGGRYDPVANTWRPISTVGAPTGRWAFTLVWAGDRMIVWGGSSDLGAEVGGRYDPVTDSWQPVSTTGQPTARFRHSAVWDGNRMIVWGGAAPGPDPNTGGRYDPVANNWLPTSTTNAPDGRSRHSAVWTGEQMIVWGGYGGSAGRLSSGGIYDPGTNSWTTTSPTGTPSARDSHSAVWTGSEMIVWGGRTSSSSATNDGGRFDPGANSWTPVSPAPHAKSAHSAIWTGSEMIVWSDGTGGRYHALTDSWTTTYSPNAPTPRMGQSAVWTGGEMIVWGGFYEAFYGDSTEQVHVNTGGSYDPVLDAWAPISAVNAPEGSENHTAVWTGSEMIVWGGYSWPAYYDTGGRYDPVGDSWTPTTLVDAPEARHSHTAVWTGSEMIVWGGRVWGGDDLNSGARYDPDIDSWTPTTELHAPTARMSHTAVWTGDKMLIWGGRLNNNSTYESPAAGGLYDPATGDWSATSTLDAPEARIRHTAVWTGSEMIVWSGINSDGATVNTGGRYDLARDAWTPTSTIDAPDGRINHTAVWTGHEMLVWSGGEWPWNEHAGSRYLLREDRWFDMVRTELPRASQGHSAVWTGERMIVWDGNETATGGSYDPDGLDGDSDQVGCVLDCDDADPGVFAAADSVGGLRFGESNDLLVWDSVAAESGPGTVYDVVRGSAADLPVGLGGEVCAEADYPLGGGTGVITLVLSEEPDPGTLFWYLVRPTNACGVGTYGTSSAGVARTTSVCD